MDESLATLITTNPEYIELIRRRSRFAWAIALIPPALLIGFLACLAWAPGIMARPVAGVFTIGMTWGLVIIAASLVLTRLYLHHSETVFEPAQRELLSHLKHKI